MDGDGDDEMIHILASKESQLEAETEVRCSAMNHEPYRGP